MTHTIDNEKFPKTLRSYFRNPYFVSTSTMKIIRRSHICSDKNIYENPFIIGKNLSVNSKESFIDEGTFCIVGFCFVVVVALGEHLL